MNKSTFVQRLALSLLPAGTLTAGFELTLKRDRGEAAPAARSFARHLDVGGGAGSGRSGKTTLQERRLLTTQLCCLLENKQTFTIRL